MFPNNLRKTALAAALISLGMAGGAIAQGTPSGGTTSAQPASPSSTGKSDAGGKSAGAVAKADRDFMEKAARGGMMEVEAGKVAQQKAQNEQVKAFGARMVQDHGKANEELKSVASSKGVTLPADMGKEHQAHIDKLQRLQGPQFDREYMSHMVKDHKKDVSEFEKTAKSAKDGEVKGFAAKTLPTLKEHLTLAQDTEKSVKGGASGKSAQDTDKSTKGGASGKSAQK
jgi:putative membrane protein